jgi:hypothetical protein
MIKGRFLLTGGSPPFGDRGGAHNQRFRYELSFYILPLMKIERKPVLLLFVVLLLAGCRRDGKGCWQAFDPQGYDAPGLVLCDKTKAEAEAAYPLFWFYRAGEKKYCWQVQIAGQTSYAWDIPESMANKYVERNGAYQFTKFDCKNFCTLEWHEKHKSKVTNQFGPTLVFGETILSADSCSRLSVGKVVVIRETADSVITRTLVKKFP